MGVPFSLRNNHDLLENDDKFYNNLTIWLRNVISLHVYIALLNHLFFNISK